ACSIGDAERRAVRETELRSCSIRGSNTLLMNVNAVDAAARDLSNSQRRAAGATRDIQQSRFRRQVEPANEQVVLIRSEPAVLADVLAKRSTAHFCIQLRCELAVLCIVMADLWCL